MHHGDRAMANQGVAQKAPICDIADYQFSPFDRCGVAAREVVVAHRRESGVAQSLARVAADKSSASGYEHGCHGENVLLSATVEIIEPVPGRLSRWS
jgi:hypothetical protein